jgi:hypothetical protein
MSNLRYIEIYSAHRDRKLYPHPSQFVIPLEQTGLRNTSSTALDPVLDAFPSYIFRLNTASTYVTEPFSSIRNFPSVPSALANQPFFGIGSTKDAPVLANTSSFDNNFYNGYKLVFINPSTGIPEARLIEIYVGSTQSCVLDSPFSEDPTPGVSTYILIDPSVPFVNIINGLNSTFSGTAAIPIVDFTGATISNSALNFALNGFPAGYFKGFYLQVVDNTTNNVLQERIITDFEQTAVGSFTYQLNLDAPITLDWTDIIVNNPGNYKFNILAAQVNLEGITISKSNPPFSFIHLQPNDVFNFSNPASYDQFYTGDYVFNELTNEGRKITYYNSILKLATLDDGFTYSSSFNPTNATQPQAALAPTYYSNANFSIRKALPYLVSTFTTSSPIGTNKVFLNPSTSPNVNDIWNGKYLYIRPYSYSYLNAPSSNNVYKINKYVGTAVPPYVIVDKALALDAIIGNSYEILNFSYDNFSPLCYTGSTVSQNELVCYEIELISLVLPNQTLKTGSRIAFYPFVYVEFGTYNSAMNHTRCSIYSNNPSSNKALFICPTSDVSNPFISQFVKLDGSGEVQTVKFKPNDNLVFSVFLPNGELFEPVFDDSESPLPPNVLLQIQATFSIKRL